MHDNGDVSLEPAIYERDAAKLLGVSVSWMRRARSLGNGPDYIRHGRGVRYEPSALRRYLASHRVTSRPDAEK